MASANQEPQSLAGHSLSVQQQQQRQQQELIKLLAQHFNQQFYQLSKSTTSNGSNNNYNSAGSQANSQSQQQLALQASASNLTVAYQQQLAHYHTNETSLLASGLAELGNMNLTTANGSQPQFFHQHLLRSQHHHQQQQQPSSNTGPNLATPESLAEFASQAPPLNPYFLNDLNLFGGLGLNFVNNPLMLSLQQQSLIQAAAAARQYELANRNEDEVDRFDTIQRESNELNRRGGNSSTNDGGNNDDSHIDSGKELLKFSISTILGKGSPHQLAAAPIKPETMLNETGNSTTRAEQASNNNNNNNLFRVSNDKQILSALECDRTQSGSDTSSLLNTTTPIPQNSSTSILFNQSSLVADHRSAASHQPLRHHQHQQQHPNHHPPMPFLPGSTAFPWTVAARGKPRRGMMRRAVFSDSQRVGLEKRFQLQKYISKPDRKKLAEKLGLRDSQVKIWFQNRRMKWRNSKERELLSAGGSREQTLPTRNNPNPDLSDVGETIKRLTAVTTNSNSSSSSQSTTESLNK